jgi:hypothetical protein
MSRRRRQRQVQQAMSAGRNKASRPPPRSDRIRRIDGGFAFVPNRFLHDGFFTSLTHLERSLYFFLVLAGDRAGVSYYAYDRICSALEVTLDDYLLARAALIDKDLIAFDGTRFQVLALPAAPVFRARRELSADDDFAQHDEATVRKLVRDTLNDDR